ncbi:MAG: TolC family protein [Gammaproteobacteria bacterium]
MRTCLAMLALSLLALTVRAETPEHRPGLDLHQAVIKVLEHNPQLKAADYTARAMAARMQAARQTKPLHLKLELQNFSGSGIYRGSESLETTLSLAKVMEGGDKPQLRGDVAQQEGHLLRSEQDAQRLDVLAETTRRFIHVVVDQQRHLIAEQKLALMQDTRRTVARRVQAGGSPVVETRRAGIAVARAELELEHAEHELASSRLHLSSLWGDTTPSFGRAQAELFNLPRVGDFTRLAALLARNPDITRFANRERLAEARLHLARAQAQADIEFGVGVRNMRRSDDHALVFSASLPLGTRQRAAPAIEAATLYQQQEGLELQQRQLELHASLFEIYQELLHAQTAFTSLQQQIIPEAEKILHAYDAGYQAGRYSLFELSEAQATLLKARLEAVMAAASYHQYQIEIERLTGSALAGVLPTGDSQ